MPPTIDNISQQKTNSWARKISAKEGKRIYNTLCERTTMVQVVDKTSFAKLLKALQSMDIHEDNVAIYQIRLLEDAKPPAEGDRREQSYLRGGLTKKERNILNKVSVSNKSINQAKASNRFIKREHTAMYEKLCVVYLDACGAVFLIRLLNVFNPKQLCHRKRHLLGHEERGGWSKGCSLSGHINFPEATRFFSRSPAVRRSYFGGNFRKYKIQNLQIAGKGKATTGRMHYKNKNGKPQAWQFGNYIGRTIYGKLIREQYQLKQCLYHQHACHVLKTLGPFVSDPQNRLQSSNSSNFLMAINQWTGGTSAPPAFHQDGTVVAACLASAMPSPDSVPFDSNQKASCNAGGLCHEIGGYIHPYGHRDAIIFNGSDLHGPTSPSPVRDKMGETKAYVARSSFVTFLNN